MQVTDEVLTILRKREESISGEEIAEKLRISRNSVWKAVKKLREDGYEIEAVTNRGYRLVSESDVLSAENIRRYLSKETSGFALEVRDEVTSTNTVLKEMGEKGGKEGMTLIAQRQTAGKGRLGRSFSSPKGTGLYMSVLLRPRFSAEESLSITTAAAVAVAEAVEAVSGRHAMIKWVNDVYLGGYKICGILTEASVDFENGGLRYAVLGMGVNLSEPEGGFPEELREIAGAVFPQGAPPGSRSRLAGEILNRFFRYYRALPQRDFMPEYRRRSLLTGMGVTFLQGEKREKGEVLGVDDEARLVVRLPDGEEKRFGAGEVQIEKSFLERLRQKEKAAQESLGAHAITMGED